MSWALVVAAPEDELDILSAELFDRGALGVEIQDREAPPMPGTPALPDGTGRCIAHFTHREDATDAARLLGRAEEPIEIAERDWSVAWKAHHRPLRLGPRTWVHPPWEIPDAGPGEVRVAIDPGMAFGTGSHPTTGLCALRLDELLAERPSADVLDVGTGSGILAVQAVLLGAERVCATENDPVALEAARRGAALNGLAGDRISWLFAGDPGEVPGAPFGIVVANILLNTLVELAPRLAGKVAPGGRLVLSGLLADQGGEAEAAYAALGLRPRDRLVRDGWVRVELERPGGDEREGAEAPRRRR
jgi:ribosomal protein L11 methyltransferase